MKKIILGDTNIRVSRLCFGTEPFTIKKGPKKKKAQGDISVSEGADTLKFAFDNGVNFWDTSTDYFSHPHVARGLKKLNRKDVIITDKINTQSYEDGKKAIKNSLSDLETYYIDVMMMHVVPLKTRWVNVNVGLSEARKRLIEKGFSLDYEAGNLERRLGTLKALREAKNDGIIRAVGISTHSSKVLKKIIEYPEIEVVLTTLNMNGSRIEDGSVEEHLDAIKQVFDDGKGVYICKIIDAGNLQDKAESAIRYVLEFESFIHAFNIGMYNKRDVLKNVEIFNNLLN